MINLGSDVVSDWSFSDGDLNVINGTGNLCQAVGNRLNASLTELNVFYNGYGSQLFDYLGELNHEHIHEYIKIEVEHRVIQDKRVRDVECIINKASSEVVKGTINVVLVDGTDIDLNMILTADNIVVTNGG